MNDISGIYDIRNLVTGDLYVGQAFCFAGRKGRHFDELARNKHGNEHLQRAWNKYGSAAFVFEPLVACDHSQLKGLEQHLLDTLPCEYNMSRIAGSPMGGRTHSEEAKRKIGEASLGRRPALGMKHSEEAKRKIGAASKGNKHRLGTRHSEATKAKIGAVHKGMKRSAETRKRMRDNNARAMLGRRASEETKRRMSESQKLAWKRIRLEGVDKRLRRGG